MFWWVHHGAFRFHMPVVLLCFVLSIAVVHEWVEIEREAARDEIFALQADIERLRGLDFAGPVDVRFIDPRTIASVGDPSAESIEQARFDVALGIDPPGSEDLEAGRSGTVVAYWDGRSIVLPTKRRLDDRFKHTIVHELVHALHTDHDLVAWRPQRRESSAAHRLLSEGDANRIAAMWSEERGVVFEPDFDVDDDERAALVTDRETWSGTELFLTYEHGYFWAEWLAIQGRDHLDAVMSRPTSRGEALAPWMGAAPAPLPSSASGPSLGAYRLFLLIEPVVGPMRAAELAHGYLAGAVSVEGDCFDIALWAADEVIGEIAGALAARADVAVDGQRLDLTACTTEPLGDPEALGLGQILPVAYAYEVSSRVGAGPDDVECVFEAYLATAPAMDPEPTVGQLIDAFRFAETFEPAC